MTVAFFGETQRDLLTPRAEWYTYLYHSARLCLSATISGARLRVTGSTKDLLAAKKENLANGVNGPSSINREGDGLHSYYLCKKSRIEMLRMQLSNKLFERAQKKPILDHVWLFVVI